MEVQGEVMKCMLQLHKATKEHDTVVEVLKQTTLKKEVCIHFSLKLLTNLCTAIEE